MGSPNIRIHPDRFGYCTVAVASLSILVALLLTQYMPRRFRIHPYPYLSDAGLRDPERVVISFGLALSSVLFLPLVFTVYLHQLRTLHEVKFRHSKGLYFNLPWRNKIRSSFLSIPSTISCEKLPPVGLVAGISLAFFLACFTAIPGWFHLHHIFALIFALSAGIWCSSYTIFTHALYQRKVPNFAQSTTKLLSILYILTSFQGIVIALFGLTWLSVKLRYPFKMIPNKDPRFIILAMLEYIGTLSFLSFIALVATECSGQILEVALGCQSDGVANLAGQAIL